jgi:DNA repair protein RadC
MVKKLNKPKHNIQKWKDHKKSHYLGHRERLRLRFQKSDPSSLHQYELLELLLTYAIPRKDVKPIAKSLIKQFKSLQGVLDADLDELKKVPGIGTKSAILINLVKELFNSYLAERMKKRDLLNSPQAAVEFAKVKLAGSHNELFMVIYLNTKNEVIDYEIVHEGTIDRAIIYPRRIVEKALVKHASSLLLIHNHPSGHTQPSEEDKEITTAIYKAARVIDVHVLDHIIVSKEDYFSFAENNFFDELNKTI